MILHICKFTSDFFIQINEEPKTYYTLASLQMIFSIHARKRKKKNYIAHFQAHKQLVLITYVKTNNDIVNLKANKWFFLLGKEKERNDIAHL
jgi:hypothetical protein